VNTNRDQLTRSLERLNTKYVDILFVHNPEYFLMTNIKGTEDNVKSKFFTFHKHTDRAIPSSVVNPQSMNKPHTNTPSILLPHNLLEHQTILLNRLQILFEELEREIEKGRIRAYGISSNSFSLKPSHAHFLPYQDLVKMAASAFERMRIQRQQEHALFLEQQQEQQPSGGFSSGGNRGNKMFPPSNSNSFSTTTKTTPLSPSHKPGSTSASDSQKRPTAPKLVQRTTHGLGYLQMPGNLLETEGLQTTAKWAKTKNLSVFINRPLNAMSPEYGPARLASYPEPLSPTYAQAKDEILGALAALSRQIEYLGPKMQRLTEMIKGLDESLRTDKLSIIQMEGASVRNTLHQELAKPVPIPHKSKVDGGSSEVAGGRSGASAGSSSLSPDAAAAIDAFKTAPTSTKPTVSTHPTATRPPTSSQPSSSTPPPSTTSSSSSSHGSTHRKIGEHEIDHLVKSLDHFIHAFHQQVRFQETARIAKIMTERGIDLKGEPIEQFAVEYLLEHDQVDAVLLGMKREPYVDFARGLLKSLAVPPPS
jgi:aryl-alcohol dehydrogenase-like predicted oxidoreductase